MERKSAFTLIEMSIVLVVVALVVGGIIVGRDMVDLAKMRKTIREVQALELAYKTFKMKYDIMPGDTAKAYVYWAGQPGCTINGNAASYGNCNGDGDGYIGTGSAEHSIKVWLHLSLAQLNPFPFVTSSANNYRPPSVFPNGLYNLQVAPFDSKHYFKGTSIIALTDSANNNIDGTNGVVIPVDAMRIDEKMDDGHPSRGNVVSLNGGVDDGKCTDTTAEGVFYRWETAPPLTYRINLTDPGCRIFFRLENN